MCILKKGKGREFIFEKKTSTRKIICNKKWPFPPFEDGHGENTF